MANHLANQTSPYLQQHKNNPVDWYPWDETALSRARLEDKPIFLSIGYAACHWCHVMAHESFENPLTAQLLNDNFINIKVDREERPDLDDIYMQAVVMLTGQGGWPMSVFLTPDLKPFYGGTYFPPVPRHGLPSFNQVINSVIDAWNNQPEVLRKNASVLTEQITKQQNHQTDPEKTADLDAVINRLHSVYDWESGGWGRAPRFPQPMLIEFLIQRALVGNPQAAELASHLLKSMARGGMYDLVGGGFHRYSTDAHWLIPHFEKMLYDNAQLALAYLHGFALTGENHYREIAESTLDFLHRDMSNPEGGFYSSTDADTPEGEGRYYAWKVDELQKLLSVDEFNYLQERTGLTQRGNFETGLNILQLIEPIDHSSDERENPDKAQFFRLQGIFKKMKQARDQRLPPGKDEKIITEWNALALRAFAEAGLLLNRQDYIETAIKGSRFILENLLSPQGQLFRTWRDGKASQPGTLADYAALILALNAVYVIDFDPNIYHHMQSLFTTLQEVFASSDNLYYDAAINVADLIVRPRNIQDNATPSGNAMAAHVHWLFANYEHDPDLLDLANQMVNLTGNNLAEFPTSFGYWLQVAGLIAADTSQIALVSLDEMSSLQPFLKIYRQTYRPFSIIAARHASDIENARYPAILDDRPTIDGKPTAYVCQGFVCKSPVTDPLHFENQLKQ